MISTAMTVFTFPEQGCVQKTVYEPLPDRVHAVSYNGAFWFAGNDVGFLVGVVNPTDFFGKRSGTENLLRTGDLSCRDVNGRKRTLFWVNENAIRKVLALAKKSIAKNVLDWFENNVFPYTDSITEVPKETAGTGNGTATTVATTETSVGTAVTGTEVLDSVPVSVEQDSDMQSFVNKEFGNIRLVYENGKVYFNGTDVCVALGYVNSRMAIQQHCDKTGIIKRYVLDTMNRSREMPFVSEPNLYRLIIRSNKPDAQKFEHWVFDEVLPAVRRSGMYMTPSAVKDYHENPERFDERLSLMMQKMDDMQKALNTILLENKEIKQLNADLRKQNEKLNMGLVASRQVQQKQAERLRYRAVALEFVKLYGKQAGILPAQFFSNELGVSSARMFNTVLVSLGVLREKRTKDGKNIHRYAQGGWQKHVRHIVRKVNTQLPNGNIRDVSFEVGQSSPGWLPSFHANIIAYIKSLGLLTPDGKFDQAKWEKGRKAVEREYRRKDAVLPQAWAKMYFSQELLPFENLSEPVQGHLFNAEMLEFSQMASTKKKAEK